MQNHTMQRESSRFTFKLFPLNFPSFNESIFVRFCPVLLAPRNFLFIASDIDSFVLRLETGQTGFVQEETNTLSPLPLLQRQWNTNLLYTDQEMQPANINPCVQDSVIPN